MAVALKLRTAISQCCLLILIIILIYFFTKNPGVKFAEYGSGNNFQINLNIREPKNSTCSVDATNFGKHQKVISFSLYMNQESDIPMFLEGIKPNLNNIQQLYPGWVVRIYTDLDKDKYFEPVRSYNTLFWCDINNIPEFGNLSRMDGRSWRFLPLGDPLVDIFVSRDLDSRIFQRERQAVQEWENSNFTIHAMRDHPWHAASLLGGMWGAKNTILMSKRSKALQLEIIKKAREASKKGWDQVILEEVVYMKLFNETLAHDSYFCGKYPDKKWLPFPTKRGKGHYVGSIGENPIGTDLVTCPKLCRRYPDWTEC